MQYRTRTRTTKPSFSISKEILPEFNLNVEWKRPSCLHADKRNAKKHPLKQIKQIAASIQEFGFLCPLLLDKRNQILAGHGRVEAAMHLKLESVPTIQVSHLSEEQRRGFVIADNRLAELGGWDQEILSIELKELSNIDLPFDLEITGFDMTAIDFLIGDEFEDTPETDENQEPILLEEETVSELGDLWILDKHRLLCGDARDVECYSLLLDGEEAQMVFSDPPYNVSVDGHVCGLGKVKHEQFAMASGEMTSKQFTDFLKTVLANMAEVSKNGAIHFICMDWRHMGELLNAGNKVYPELKNLCVWSKSNAGMGSFYRSQHELVFVYKVGTTLHINNFGLGDIGRYRTNVWEYPGMNSFMKDRDKAL